LSVVVEMCMILVFKYIEMSWKDKFPKENRYFETENGILYKGECLEIMKKFQKESFGSIITDPPYGTTSCSWDAVIPFDKMWESLKKIRKNCAPIVLFGSEPFFSTLIVSNIDEFKEEVIWLKNKSGSGLNANIKHIKVHEKIGVFGSSKSTFNPQKWLVDKREFLTQRKTFNEVEVGNNIYSKMKRVQSRDNGERNPISVVTARVPFTPSKTKKYNNDVDLRFHPTQKPLALMEYLIKTYSNEGDLVLDFTCGSWTTLVACEKLNRRWIGIELNEEYCEIAKQRILEINKTKTLFDKNS